jgi:hypothetical protein
LLMRVKTGWLQDRKTLLAEERGPYSTHLN